MRSIRIKNMRSLIDTEEINLKTINMLVGSNSSGKSTFLRIFPLLKQSFFRRINGPILWAGDEEDYVDFGSYKETISKNAQENYIGLEFTIPYKIENIKQQLRGYTLFNTNKAKTEETENEAKIGIEISNKNNMDIISKIIIKCNEEELYIDKENEKEYINSVEIKKEHKMTEIEKKYRDNYVDFLNERSSILSILYDSFRERSLYYYILNEIFKNDTVDNNKTIHTKEISTMFKEDFVNRLIIEVFTNKNFEINDFIRKYKREMKYNEFSTLNKIQEKNINLKFFQNNKNINLLKVLVIKEVGNFCIDYIQSYFMRVNYIKPVRAHAERYYRLRNLSVDQIDADGRNLPIFINSLSEKKLNEYNDWLCRSFDFKIIPMQTDGHVSINIETENKRINLSDTGYGYSQLLPIITQLWVILNTQMDSKEKVPVVLAIEQPELHLHPELQAKLIDIIANIAKNKKDKIQFILETHSETMINRLGNLIYKNKISEKDVNIVIFEKKNDDFNTKVQISKFNKDGYLENWPIGFFSVDDVK